MKAPLLRLLLVSMLLLPALCAGARGTRGETSFGPKLGYVSRNSSATVGLVFQYSPSSVVRLSPEVGLVFRHKNLDAMTADVNVHFPFKFAQGRGCFYPLAGVGFTSWGRHDIDEATSVDVTNHSNLFGINMGAGVEGHVSKSLKLGVEARYSLMRHLPTAYVTAGVAFVF